jgi:hypothetical protein
MTYQRLQRMSTKETSEFALLHKEIQEMKDSTANELAELRKVTDRILRTLVGDEEMAQEGLVSKVKRHEEYIESQKLFWAKLSGIAIGGGAIGGFILNLLTKLF